jgi:hypothetical protein
MNENTKSVLISVPVILVILGIAAYASWLSVSANPPVVSDRHAGIGDTPGAADHHRYGNEVQSKTDGAPSIENVQAANHNGIGNRPEENRMWYTKPDWWVALFTGALFFVTAGLWCATWRMWKATQEAANAGKDAAQATRDSIELARNCSPHLRLVVW